MKFNDMIQLGLANLWRTKLRTTLTTLGVVIGIGALTSMISFGTGMEKNITETFKKNDLFTSLHITPRAIDMEGLGRGEVSGVVAGIAGESVTLTDSVLEVIRAVEGIEIAYPELSFRAKLEIMGKEREITVAGVPVDLKSHPPFDDITFGAFFESDSSHEVLIRWETLKRMKIIVEDPDDPVRLSWNEEDEAFIIVPPDSLIGKSIRIMTVVMDYGKVTFNPLQMLMGDRKLPVSEKETEFILGGIIRKDSPFAHGGEIRGDLLVPFQRAAGIPRLGFTNIWDALGGDREEDSYSSIYVKVHSIGDMDPVIRILKEDMSLNVFALSDQLREVRRAFLILDGILGAIGTIALVVAGLGIVNTMLMSILERTREIGIMKAIGGSERQIKLIFFVEAGTIGLIGAVLGLLLGKGVTLLANEIANSQFLPAGEPPVNFFYFPLWLITGAILFSILLSMAAGLYPAIRAARVDPVRALRHD